MWLRTHGTQLVVEALSSDHARRLLKLSVDVDDSEYYSEQQAGVIHGTVPAVSYQHCPGHRSRILT